MAAYRTANRLFPGLHMPLMGMGMEYQRMNNLHLAEQMFLQVGGWVLQSRLWMGASHDPVRMACGKVQIVALTFRLMVAIGLRRLGRRPMRSSDSPCNIGHGCET